VSVELSLRVNSSGRSILWFQSINRGCVPYAQSIGQYRVYKE